ncbi:uncharacterized protein TNCV_4493901 [Trichonephila clavipes]|nr:uncharacterized protein TNCV_4493901 [Trichonephila clavipes]
MLNDDEIGISVQAVSDPVDNEMDEDEDNNESSKGPSNADAFSALETAMEWYEQQSECCPTHLLLLKRESETLQRKNKGVQCAVPYKRIQIAAGNFDAQFPPRGRHLSSDDANLYQDLILPRASRSNRHSKGLLHAVYTYDMTAVDFLPHENPPTWAGVEPTTLGAESQRQTNHATQPACQRLYISSI